MTGDIVGRLLQMSRFLRGEAEMKGAWFGDNAYGERGKFWWRKYLPLTEAATLIESLRADNAAMRGALASIATANDLWGTNGCMEMRKVARAALTSIAGK